ncbi:hypothetical protein HK097_001649 [Rhizophlyctis rosea]|uniref:Uncharacterized protein n=1 Tax=Rhizophlyctis rosea TaxID=64517 RepID=A0AAD5S6J6_9FUNG|nr:hypothetical protein HK097_001649 [Rhizophlyctis rosea]
MTHPVPYQFGSGYGPVPPQYQPQTYPPQAYQFNFHPPPHTAQFQPGQYTTLMDPHTFQLLLQSAHSPPFHQSQGPIASPHHHNPQNHHRPPPLAVPHQNPHAQTQQQLPAPPGPPANIPSEQARKNHLTARPGPEPASGYINPYLLASYGQQLMDQKILHQGVWLRVGDRSKELEKVLNSGLGDGTTIGERLGFGSGECLDWGKGLRGLASWVREVEMIREGGVKGMQSLYIDLRWAVRQVAMEKDGMGWAMWMRTFVDILFSMITGFNENTWAGTADLMDRRCNNAEGFLYVLRNLASHLHVMAYESRLGVHKYVVRWRPEAGAWVVDYELVIRIMVGWFASGFQQLFEKVHHVPGIAAMPGLEVVHGIWGHGKFIGKVESGSARISAAVDAREHSERAMI